MTTHMNMSSTSHTRRTKFAGDRGLTWHTMVRSAMDDIGVRFSEGKEPEAELGMARDGGKLVPITVHTPRIRNRLGIGRRCFSQLLQRVVMTPGLQSMLASDVRASWNELQRKVQRNESQAEIEAFEDRFVQMIGDRAQAISEDMARHGYGADTLPAQDQALYFLASAFAAIQRTILITYALPTITSILPIQRYNTTLRNWTDFYEIERGGLAEPAPSTGGGVGSGGHPERVQVTGPLRQIKHAWRLEEDDIDRHNESRGREGAPEWDLLNRVMDINSALLVIDRMRLVCFGSNPDEGVVPVDPVDMRIPGWLYSKTPVAVNFDQASGEDNYNAIRAFIRQQRDAASWAPGLVANVLTLSAPSYFDLKTQYVNSGGMEQNVIDALLTNVPGLDRIEVALEYKQLPAELQHLQDIGHPLATYVAGGVFVGTDEDANVVNAQREAITLHKDSVDVVSQQDGHDLQMKDNALTDGIFQGMVGVSTGGTRVSQPFGVSIGYQAV